MKRTTPDLRNRTVVITGASAGVGRAVALCFARSGATLGLIARDAAALDEVKQEVEKLGGNALVLPADVADANAVFEAADTIASARGGIDIWINDAMVTVFAPVWEIAPQEFRRVTEYWLGASTLKAILGNMLLPGFLDRYLAKNAYDAQETDTAVSPMRKII